MDSSELHRTHHRYRTSDMGEREVARLPNPRKLTTDRDRPDDAVFGMLFGNSNLFPEVSAVRVGNAVDIGQYLPNVLTTIVMRPAAGATVDYFARPDTSMSVIYQRYAQAYNCSAEDLVSTQARTAEMVSELRRKVSGMAQLSANWDGEGALAVSVETVDTSFSVIEHIAIVLERKNTNSIPTVRPFPDGSIFFKWIRGQKELAITVNGRDVEAQRWEPLDSFHSQGLWEISVDATSEQVDWVLT